MALEKINYIDYLELFVVDNYYFGFDIEDFDKIGLVENWLDIIEKDMLDY